MHVETMVYAYLAICGSMIVFNCVCVFVFRGRSTVLQKHSDRLESEIQEQMDRIAAGMGVEERHKAFLQKKLGRTANLLAFDATLERLLAQEPDPEEVWAYISEIASVFTYLAVKNQYHSAMKMTYFAYVVRKYKIMEGRPVRVIVDVMMTLMREPGLYCRENALQAIYSTGDCTCVLRALLEVDTSRCFHHSKLLTDGLLTFGGDREALAHSLWQAFDRFSTQMQVAILDFIRFSGVDMRQELLPLLADARRDDEIRFSCIRYFGKYPYEPAYPLLLSFAERSVDMRWEYAAIAVTALASYPGERSVEVLKKDLNNSNWYVRFNAAKSLESFHLAYLELSDVMEGGDRYAREILQYQLDLDRAQKERKGAVV